MEVRSQKELSLRAKSIQVGLFCLFVCFQVGSTTSVESNTELELTILKSRSELRSSVGPFTDGATQAPLQVGFRKLTSQSPFPVLHRLVD